MDPTASPSRFPTTPSPTHPSALTCGSHQIGAYNGWPLRFEVEMTHIGYLQFDASASDFVITSITAMDVDGNRLAMDSDHDDVMILDAATSGDYVFVVTAGKMEGVFEVDILCGTPDRRRLINDQYPIKIPSVVMMVLVVFSCGAFMWIIGHQINSSSEWLDFMDKSGCDAANQFSSIHTDLKNVQADDAIFLNVNGSVDPASLRCVNNHKFIQNQTTFR